MKETDLAKHNYFHYRKDTWIDKVKRWFTPHFKWVVRNPEFTKKDPPKIKDIFALK